MPDGTNIGKAYLQVVPVAKGIQGSLTSVLNGEAGSAGESAGKSIASKIKSTIVASGIGLAIGNIIKQGLDLGGELQQSMGGVASILGDEAFKQVNAYAQSAAKDLQISANDYMQQVTSFSARLMQGLGGDTQATVKYADMAIRDMSDNANKMGTSIESIQNAYQGFAKNNFTMLDNLKLGYGGTQSEMIRLINDSGVLGRTISSLDGITFDQMVAAIHQVQDNMGIAGTSSVEAQTTIQGSMNSLKAAWENFVANMTLGEDVQPALDTLFETFTNTFNNVVPAVINIVGTIPGAILDTIVTLAPTIIEAGMNALMSMIQGLTNKMPELVPKMAQAISLMVTTLAQHLPQLIDAGIKLIAALVKGLIQAIPQIWQSVKKAIVDVISNIKGYLPQWLDIGKQMISGLANGIGSMIGSVISRVKGYVGNIISSVKNFFGIHSPSRVFAEMGEMNMLGLAQGIEDNLQPVSNAMDEAAKLVTSDLESQIGINPISGLSGFGETSQSTNYGGVNINVYATDGQSARSIAEEVMDIMQNQVTRNRMVFE